MLSSFSEREGVADPDGRVELPVVGEALELRAFLVGVDILLVIIIGPAGGRRRARLARRPRAPRLRPGLDIVGRDSRAGKDGDLLVGLEAYDNEIFVGASLDLAPTKKRIHITIDINRVFFT